MRSFEPPLWRAVASLLFGALPLTLTSSLTALSKDMHSKFSAFWKSVKASTPARNFRSRRNVRISFTLAAAIAISGFFAPMHVSADEEVSRSCSDGRAVALSGAGYSLQTDPGRFDTDKFATAYRELERCVEEGQQTNNRSDIVYGVTCMISLRLMAVQYFADVGWNAPILPANSPEAGAIGRRQHLLVHSKSAALSHLKAAKDLIDQANDDPDNFQPENLTEIDKLYEQYKRLLGSTNRLTWDAALKFTKTHAGG